MSKEQNFRRPDFREGVSVCLADGNFWTLPAPGGQAGEDPGPAGYGEFLGPEGADLFSAIREAEDRSERYRAELALAIHLLGRNYRLGPAEYQDLLGFTPGSPALRSAQEAFREVARVYLQVDEMRNDERPARLTRARSPRPRAGQFFNPPMRLGGLLQIRRSARTYLQKSAKIWFGLGRS